MRTGGEYDGETSEDVVLAGHSGVEHDWNGFRWRGRICWQGGVRPWYAVAVLHAACCVLYAVAGLGTWAARRAGRGRHGDDLDGRVVYGCDLWRVHV